jgi:hypothetical protein
LQALTSSPHALAAQLTNMARNATVPKDLAATVGSIAAGMKTSAKLQGLGILVDQLMQQNPKRWRMVVFTTRLETQTTIQAFLEERGLQVGIINGLSGRRNQDTIKQFWKDPPECHVIVSTEAGSEGVNLQAANVLVNYDLPWNPMIVEQRIGRIQRLASEHAKVSILNIILRSTFEEFIVGRLMEKLQMAAHAIGDIEALLEAAGIDDDEENGGSFDDKILQLVLAALAGKDVERATRLTEESILDAGVKLAAEESNINAMLGSMAGMEYVGPRAPNLPPIIRSMGAAEFTLAALNSLDGEVMPQDDGSYLVEQDGGREWIRLDESAGGVRSGALYAPGSAAFSRLVSRMIATGVHQVQDVDADPQRQADEITRSWVARFGATPITTKVEGARHCFEGKARVRVRATVAHDSYERLVEVTCAPGEHKAHAVRSALYKLTDVIENAHYLGIDMRRLNDAAGRDPGIAEFCRFYVERRTREMASAGDDARKRKKLEDDFTPRLELTVVALEGTVHREVATEVQYRIDGSPPYTSQLTVVPHTGLWTNAPELGSCGNTGKTAPIECLGRCAMTGVDALQHLLVESEISGRQALPEHTLHCSLSGKRILVDEAEMSAVTGKLVAHSLLKTSAVSGKRAEPEHFGRCDFSGAEVLNVELGVSAVSGKRYRLDQQLRSAVSSNAGHKEEFLFCYETRQPITPKEAETCEVTGKFVRPGVLEKCAAIEAAHVSPDKQHVAICSEVRTLLGLRVQQAGLLYSMRDGSIVGRIAIGKRTPKGWISAGS